MRPRRSPSVNPNRPRTLGAIALALALAVPALVGGGAMDGGASGRAFATAPTPTPPPSTVPPALESREAILVDLATGQVLFRKLPHRHRPIASLTKIMTAVVVLERLSPSARVTVTLAEGESRSRTTTAVMIFVRLAMGRWRWGSFRNRT